jgi:hypothetical protein
MSVIRPKLPEDPIAYEPTAAWMRRGTSPDRRDAAEAGLEESRKDLLGCADVVRPDQLLDAYNTGGGRADSQLFAILQAARRIRDTVDRVIVLGDGCGPLGARAIFESCAHPCHNDLSRGERGGRPRLSFVGSPLDNDAMQGLLDLVTPAGKPRGSDLLDQWAIIVGGTTDGGPGMEAWQARRPEPRARSERQPCPETPNCSFAKGKSQLPSVVAMFQAASSPTKPFQVAM